MARSSRTGGAGGGDDDDDEDGEKLSDAKLNEFQELKQKTLLNLALVSLKLRVSRLRNIQGKRGVWCAR